MKNIKWIAELINYPFFSIISNKYISYMKDRYDR